MNFNESPPAAGPGETGAPVDAVAEVAVVEGFALFAAYAYASYLWLTSLGDSGAIGKAKKIYAQATIGLVVILLSYGLLNTLITGLQ